MVRQARGAGTPSCKLEPLPPSRRSQPEAQLLHAPAPQPLRASRRADQVARGAWQGYISDSMARISESEHEGSGSGDGGSVDVLVALHACDTATDDALRAGISAGARVIIVAPCCHKELRGQMDGPRGQQRSGGVLQDVFAYGILAGRMAETTTDAIRALLLQIMGYRTHVFEFIDGVHTAKNVMITAIRKDAGKLTAKEEAEEAGRRAALRSRLAELMSFFGVGVQRLAMLLGENPETDDPRYLHQVPACLVCVCVLVHVCVGVAPGACLPALDSVMYNRWETHLGAQPPDDDHSALQRAARALQERALPCRRAKATRSASR